MPSWTAGRLVRSIAPLRRFAMIAAIHGWPMEIVWATAASNTPDVFRSAWRPGENTMFKKVFNLKIQQSRLVTMPPCPISGKTHAMALRLLAYDVSMKPWPLA